MKKKIFCILILTSFLVPVMAKFTFVLTACNLELKGSPEEILRIEKIIKNDDGLLSDDDKKKIVEIKDKMERFEAISQEEIDYIRQCESNIIRSKLGDVTFEEYSKLIRKRASKDEFTPPERFRLLEIEKILRE